MLAMVMTTTVAVMMMAVGTLFVVGAVSSFSFCELKWRVLVAVAVAVVEQQTPLMVVLVVVADQS